MPAPILRNLEAAGFSVVRSILVARGRSTGGAAASCLVIAPHPDDETLGCGATIARKVEAGRRVAVLFVTDGRRSHRSRIVSPERLGAIRRDEAAAACAVLGVGPDRIRFGECLDGAIAEQPDAARAAVSRAVEEFSPEEVYAPSGIDRSEDHRAVAAAVERQVAEGAIACPVYAYPIWFWNLRTWVGGDGGALRGIGRALWGPLRAALTLEPLLVPTDGFLEVKRRALAAHASQLRNLTGEPGWGTIQPEFLRSFFTRHEIFFPLRPCPGRGRA